MRDRKTCTKSSHYISAICYYSSYISSSHSVEPMKKFENTRKLENVSNFSQYISIYSEIFMNIWYNTSALIFYLIFKYLPRMHPVNVNNCYTYFVAKKENKKSFFFCNMLSRVSAQASNSLGKKGIS